MKAKCLALMIGACFSHNLRAANNITIGQRLAELEQRVASAEKQASDAEAQIRSLRQQQVTATLTVNVQSAEPIAAGETPPKLTLSGFSDIKLYGDVEFNMDAASRSNSPISTRTSASKDWVPRTNERQDISRCLLLGFGGYQRRDNGNFAGFSVQPLADLTGKMNLDDTVFFSGCEDGWEVKIGRFEAYGMFPLNQDTFVEYSGNAVNNLYGDGYSYIYMMKEGWGRDNSEGNFLLNKTISSWYFEINTLLKDSGTLCVEKRYHGMDLANNENVAYVRPIIVWQNGRFSTAMAMESNIVNNAYGHYQNGTWIDQSDRTGYGFTVTWNGQKTDPEDDAMINLNTAHMNATDETDFTAGVNALWHRFELGYIYAHNKIEAFNTTDIDAACEDDCWITDPGNYDIHTIHASYLFPNVMDMKNFNIYLGAYTSQVKANPNNDDNSEDTRYGGRLRFKYYF